MTFMAHNLRIFNNKEIYIINSMKNYEDFVFCSEIRKHACDVVEFDALMKIVSTIQMKEIKLQPFTKKKRMEEFTVIDQSFATKYGYTAAYLYVLLGKKKKNEKIFIFYSCFSFKHGFHVK